ncbi:MAG: nitrogenase component 1 [Candidatus Methanoplasma sp.]|jgi:nitrogenase molybdenum-iron protein alpha/beta subunit|nr:nitrogenase component 1 [Candidatus Methanoplasma sp.]
MYVLDQNEVVFGCRKGLVAAVKEMDRSGAEAVMLISTCIPEVIGEDLECMIREMQPDIKAKLSIVRIGHFKCNSHPSGIWKTLVAYGDLMEDADTRSDTVNVLGRGPDGDHPPMPKLLKELSDRGFRLRFLAPGSGIDDFIAAPDASLNLVVSQFMNPLADMMSQRYGISAVSLHETYDVEGIDLLHSSVADALNISWDSEFKEQREKAAALQKQAADVFRGTQFVMTRENMLMPLPLAAYLSELGMIPALIHMEEYYPDDKKWAKVLIEKGHDPLVCHMVNEETDAKAIELVGPDISFGEIPRSSGKIRCVCDMQDLYGCIGYERTIALLERMLTVLNRRNGTEA